MSKHQQYYLVSFTVLLTFCVIVLGAYTRLTHSGLGCPDWPGCYGHMVVPQTTQAIQKIKQVYQGAIVETTKAWTEMAHRYLAMSLLVCISTILLMGYWSSEKHSQPMLPIFIVLIVVIQAILGMWTVTWKLHPAVVMGHLLGGLMTLSLVWLLRLQLTKMPSKDTGVYYFRHWGLVGLVIVSGQIALGGWTSANYAGISCLGFPACNGSWLPSMNFDAAFHISPIGANYQGGLLDASSRVTIQMVHRIGAMITAVYLSMLAGLIWYRAKTSYFKKLAMVMLFCMVLQFSLGIVNVLYLLPLSAAVLHNAVAAILLLCLVTLSYHSMIQKREPANDVKF